jgi:hypothetical protein
MVLIKATLKVQTFADRKFRGLVEPQNICILLMAKYWVKNHETAILFVRESFYLLSSQVN